MDKQIDVEKLRASLAEMTRAEVRKLAIGVGLKPSTIEKFRLNHIGEPRLSKLQKIRDGLAAYQKAAKRAPAPAANNAMRQEREAPSRSP